MDRDRESIEIEELYDPKIIFENSDDGIYFTCDSIFGFVEIGQNFETLRCVKIKLQGIIKTTLEDRNGETIEDTEVFLENEITLNQGDQAESESDELTNKLSFQFINPFLKYPMSFEGDFGSIQYKLLLSASSIDKPEEIINLAEKIVIHNLKRQTPSNLELNTDYEVPINYTMDKDINSDLHFKFKVCKSSFEFGEEIPFLLEIFDKHEDVGAKISLIQKIIYRSKELMFKDYSEVISKLNDEIDKSNLWDDFLIIPFADLPPIHFGFPNDLMDVNYYLQVDLLSCNEFDNDGERKVLTSSGQMGLIIGSSYCEDDDDFMSFISPSSPAMRSAFDTQVTAGCSSNFVRKNAGNKRSSLPTYSMLSIGPSESLPPTYTEATLK